MVHAKGLCRHAVAYAPLCAKTCTGRRGPAPPAGPLPMKGGIPRHPPSTRKRVAADSSAYLIQPPRSPAAKGGSSTLAHGLAEGDDQSYQHEQRDGHGRAPDGSGLKGLGEGAKRGPVARSSRPATSPRRGAVPTRPRRRPSGSPRMPPIVTSGVNL